jgi:chromosome segregation ATPase
MIAVQNTSVSVACLTEPGNYLQDERDKIKANLTQATVSVSSVSATVEVKDKHIAELSAEGTRLAAHAGQLEAHIRKLRQQLKAATEDAESHSGRVSALEVEGRRLRERIVELEGTLARVEETAERRVWLPCHAILPSGQVKNR